MSDEEDWNNDDDYADEEYIELESPIEPPADIGDEDADLISAADLALPPAVQSDNSLASHPPPRPHKKKKMAKDKRLSKLDWPESLPYQTETLEEFDARLDFISKRLVQCVETQDYDIGLPQWTNRLQFLMSLKYPMRRETRASLALLYYNIVLTPGCHPRTMDTCANQAITLLAPRRLINNKDLTLPWKPLLDLIVEKLFPKARATGSTSVSTTLLALAETAQRFFPPSEAEAMLEEILPQLDGSCINTVVCSQAFLVHFLPLSRPHSWLPTIFRLWETFKSLFVDDQMLDLIARLSQHHIDPSGPGLAEEDDDDDEDDVDDAGDQADPSDSSRDPGSSSTSATEPGIWKDVGLLTSDQFAMIMAKALRIASLPVGVGGRLAGSKELTHRHTSADSGVSEGTLNIKKPTNSITSLATILVYSMSEDGPPILPSGVNTPASGSNGQAAGASQQRFLAGSRALDSFARYLQATEQYFHPSNWGHWSPVLTSFVSEMSSIFYRRWKEEQSRHCKTPQSRRLTPSIKREFVKSAQNVCLVAMFGKDIMSIAHTQKALKRMALLEPDLIMDKFLSRAYEDLEDLETSHRTTAVLSALSALSYPLVCKDLYSKGPSSLPELLIRCLPAIDPTDHTKTLTSCGFVASVLATVRLDDLTRPELFDTLDESDRDAFPGLHSDDEEVRAKAEEVLAIDDAIRFSTSAYEEWVINFMDRVLLVCKSLPEEGARGKIGGKQEEAVTSALAGAVSCLVECLSPHLFKRTFDHVFRFCEEEPSANAVRMIGNFVGCFARVDPTYVLDRIIPMTIEKIKYELDHGAASRRTTSTHTASPADTRLHWYLGSLTGALTRGGSGVLKHRDALHGIITLLVDRALSERSYAFTARLVARLINKLCATYPENASPLNPNEWSDPKIARNVHRTWGKMYEARDVQYQWHVPTQEEIGFALHIVKEIVEPAVAHLEEMQSVEIARRDKVWSNDFCRRLTLVRHAYEAMATLVMESDDCDGEVASDVSGQGCLEFVANSPRLKSGFALTDPSSPQYQYVVDFRNKVGQMLYHCGVASSPNAAEDKQDCTKLLLRTIRSYMTEYSYASGDYHIQLQSWNYYATLFKLYPRQQAMPRLYWFRRAAYYHLIRGRTNSYFRRRTSLHDKLIKEVILEYCMSTYVSVRKTAQNTLESIASRYDGTRSLCLPALFDAVKPGVDDDRMKGALYVLGQKNFAYLASNDPRLSAPYVLCLLNAHHHPKPSLQQLVRSLLSYFAMKFVEPSALRFELEKSPSLVEAAKQLRQSLPQSIWEDDEKALLEDVRAARAARKANIEQLYQQFTPEVLAVAQDDTRHWSVLLWATRILRPLVCKDRPLSPELTAFFARGLLSPDKAVQAQHTAALVKTLYYIKVRTLAKSKEDLVRGKGRNPLKKSEKLQLPVGAEYAQKITKDFFVRGDPASWKVRDRTYLGWLTWGSKEDYYELPPRHESPYQWEEASLPAVEALRTFVTDRQWWNALFVQLSQEKDRKSGNTENVHLFKGLSQIFGVTLFKELSPFIEQLVSDKDRHKQRAAAEALSGLVRGSKHWPLDDQERLWSWFAPLLETIFKGVTHDSSLVWEASVSDICRERDPRRVAPLLDFVIKKVSAYLEGGETVMESIAVQKRAHAWLGTVIHYMDRKLLLKATELSDAYWKNIDTPYTELRLMSLSNMKSLDYFYIAPQYGSTQELLQASRTSQPSAAWQRMHATYTRRFEELRALLAETLPQRTPISQGVSRYDNVAMYAITTLVAVCGDWRATPILEVVVDFLPCIFQMLELKDNNELVITAADVLTRIVAQHWGPGPMPVRLVRQLIKIFDDSRDSWRTRLEALGYLQIAYFENLFYLAPADVKMIVDMLLVALKDARPEVREIASSSLSGIVRSSQRNLISDLSKRFTHTVVTSPVPVRGTEGYSDALIQLHSGILGCVALVNAFPYEVPPWMPSLLVETLCQHTDDPPPINTTIKNCARDFKRTHQDNWKEQSKAFTSDDLAEVNAWALGRSDYFV